MATYVAHSEKEIRQMMDFLGINEIDELFADIAQEVKIKGSLNLPKGKSELEVRQIMSKLAGKNKVFETIFRGAGAYNHYIPSIVKAISSKESFVTAYTPYQPEISQGVLQAIYEYQSIICELTGMDASNASIYDGASAAAEAAAMCADNRRKKILISATSKNDTVETLKTYCKASGAELIIIPEVDGITDLESLKGNIENAACLYVEMPNKYGILEDYSGLGEVIHEFGGKFIMGVNPMLLSVMKSPAEFGADIAVGEAQVFGMPLSFGGPYLGFMACKNELTRKLPGRIVGETLDHDGKRAYVLTLQAREQHIRREKASSNVCSNQALCALTAVAYIGAMGTIGLEDVAKSCYSKAHYAAQKLSEIQGFELVYPREEFFHEFVTKCPDNEKILSELEKHDILGGLPLENGILWCFTEMNTKEEIDRLCEILKEAR